MLHGLLTKNNPFQSIEEGPRRSSNEFMSLNSTAEGYSDDYNTEKNYLSKSSYKDCSLSKAKVLNDSDSDNYLKRRRSKSAEHVRHGDDHDSRKSKKRKEKKKRESTFETLENNFLSLGSSDTDTRRYRRLLEQDDSSGEERGRPSYHVCRKAKHAVDKTQLQDEIKQINIVATSNDEVIARVASVDERLRRLEENTQMSLYNIEALLRNFIFYQSSARPGAGSAASSRGAAGRFASEYGQGFYNDRI